MAHSVYFWKKESNCNYFVAAAVVNQRVMKMRMIVVSQLEINLGNDLMKRFVVGY